eukprot:scaffold146748_cov32-Tisochrysis_lutea.AAC.8
MTTGEFQRWHDSTEFGKTITEDLYLRVPFPCVVGNGRAQKLGVRCPPYEIPLAQAQGLPPVQPAVMQRTTGAGESDRHRQATTESAR